MDPAQCHRWRQPGGSGESLANSLLHVGAEQQAFAVAPAPECSTSLLHFCGSATQQDHAANTCLQQPLQLTIAMLPTWVLPLSVFSMAAGTDDEKPGHGPATLSFSH